MTTLVEAFHTPQCKHPVRYKGEPLGMQYIAWHEWAERKGKTQVQERCEHCGLYAIWRSRKSGRMMAAAR